MNDVNLENMICAQVDSACANPDWDSPMCWSFDVASDSKPPERATIRVMKNWFMCDSPWPRTNETHAHRLSWYAERLPMLSKACLGADLAPRLRTEIPLTDGDEDAPSPDSEERAHAAIASFMLASEMIRKSPAAPAVTAPMRGDLMSPETFIDYVAPNGWTCAMRDSGLVTVDLGVPGMYVQAMASLDAVAVCIDAGIAAHDAPTPECVDATERFLMRAAGHIHMVAAWLNVSQDDTTARIGLRLPPRPNADLLNHALSALSVAASTTAREARVLLANPVVAREYLART
jgi:hypothetical protein